MCIQNEFKNTEVIAIAFFIFSIIIYGIFYLQEGIHVEIEASVFINWMTLLIGIEGSICFLAAGAAIFLYNLNRKLRDLLFAIGLFNTAFLSFTFALTYPGIMFQIPFAESLPKSQLLIAMASLAVPISLVLGYYNANKPLSRESVIAISIIGFLIIPLIAIITVLSPISPQPFAIENQGLTTTGILVSVLAFFLVLYLIVIYGAKWKTRETPLPTVVLLAMLMIVTATVFTVGNQGAYRISALIAIVISTEGLAFLAFGIFKTFTLEQNLSLQETVELRTQELEVAKEESDFYLCLWSHDIGNLLQALRIYLDILELDSVTSSKEQTSIEKIAERISSIINRVQEAAQIRDVEVELKSISIVDSVNQAISILKEVLDLTMIKVDLELPTDDIFIQADGFLTQIFVNLIKNSLDHCGENSPRVRISASIENNTALVDISDSCPQLPTNVRESLFEKFVPSESGLGLGLFIVKKLVIRYQGSIKYSRKENRNIFSIRLKTKS